MLDRFGSQIQGKRRKDHLKRLEDSQHGQGSDQTDLIERLQRQNTELFQENRTLRSMSQGSVSSSRSPHIPISSPLSVSSSSFAAFPSSESSYLTPALVRAPSAPGPEAGLIFLAPHSFGDLCSYIYTTCPAFNLVLEQPIQSHAQSDLITLSTIITTLPPALRPTELQLSTPHHPLFEITSSRTARRSPTPSSSS